MGMDIRETEVQLPNTRKEKIPSVLCSTKPRLRSMALPRMGVAVMVVLFMAEQSMQLRSVHKLYEAVERINNKAESYIGLVMADTTEQQVLHSSGFFVPDSDNSTLQMAGRTFNIGTIKGVDVIYVMTGEQMVNAAMTVQILVDTFNIAGIVHYGTAGSANDSLSFGSVSVPISVAFTSSWKWKEFKSETGSSTELTFGDFNLPEKGENLLANIEFEPTQFYSTGKPTEEVFWLQIDAEWFNISTQLQDVKLEQCVNDTYCLTETPKVVYGLRGSTADVYLDNAAYRQFLFNQFNVSTVDEESAAIVMTSLSNEVPCIVFRGVSDLAGGGTLTLSSTNLSSLAAINALTVAVDFIGLFAKQDSFYDQLN